MKRLLMFDYDGVIVDSAGVVLMILNNLATQYGFAIKTKNDLGLLFEKNVISGLVEAGLSIEKAKQLPADLKSQFEKYGMGIKPFDGMINLLQETSANNILAIVTSNHSDIPRALLKKHKCLDCFDSILGGEEHASKLEKIKLLCEKCEASNSAEAVFISDTSGDIREAKEAGLNTIGVTWGYQTRELLARSNPDYLVDSVIELEKIIVGL